MILTRPYGIAIFSVRTSYVGSSGLSFAAVVRGAIFGEKGPPVEINSELATYLQPGPFSTIIASCDSELVPETVRGWGQSVHEDGLSIVLCVGREPARRLLQNLGRSNWLAVSIANVTTYQAIQLKGHCVNIDEPEAEDRARVRAHGDEFVAGLRLVGVSEQAARGILVSDVIRLRFIPEILFDQTPGPEAGTQR
jgi:hypothetical protein